MRNKIFFIIIVFITSPLFSVGQKSGDFEFIENKGQWDDRVKFKSQMSLGSFYLQDSGFTILLHDEKDKALLAHGRHLKKSGALIDEKILHSHAYSVTFLGANSNPVITPFKIMESFNNYFIGNLPSRWAVNCKIYKAVRYKNVYPQIDVLFYSEDGNLKYDFIIHPGGDVRKIKLKYEGMEQLNILNNELIVKTSVGEIKEIYPYSYQVNNKINAREEIKCKYHLTDKNIISFEIDKYSISETLVIDPTLIFSTFSGSSVDNWGFSATPGPDGSTFAAGIVFGDGFPASTGAFQTKFRGGGMQGTDIGIMKLSADGSKRVYATYLGGGGDEYPHSLITDRQGNLIIAGRTYSADYPTTGNTVIGLGGKADIIVTKLNDKGNVLLGSLRIGGKENDGVNIDAQHQTDNHKEISLIRNYGDESRSEVILDAYNNIYLASSTQSPDFPVTQGVFQSTYGGGLQDGVIIKIDPGCTNVLFSGFLGGSKEDGAFVLAYNPITNSIYVAGGTASADFPGDKNGAVFSIYQGGVADGFVSIISANGSTLLKSSFLGTNNVDIIYGIQLDKNGFPYVMGTTRGNWPVINAAYVNNGAKQFIAKLQPDLSNYIFSTTFGTNNPLPNISPVAFLVDRCENIYVSGWGGYLVPGNDPYGQAGTAGMPVTADAIKKTTDGFDFYFIVIKKNASELLYATFFGQEGGNVNDHVDGGTSRYDPNGVIHQAVCANCGGNAVFPTSPGSWAQQNGTGSKGCNLAAVKIAFNFAGVASGVRSFINNSFDSTGCTPLQVIFRDTVLNAKMYEWNFGDGSPELKTSNYEVSYVYEKVGNYRVRLVAIDSNSCNIRDTSYVNIIVGENRASLKIKPAKLPPCESFSYKFENFTTSFSGLSLNNINFTWDFGDGIRKQTKGLEYIVHSFPSPGIYKIRLILMDSSFCNTPDSMEIQLSITANVKAQFEIPQKACSPFITQFKNTSLGGTQFFWDFGDGNSSTEVNPTHTYLPGNYSIMLISVDSSTCNLIDTIKSNLQVFAKPIAAMDHNPKIPVYNKPIIFSNTSEGAIKYIWYLGDGDSAISISKDPVSHQYNQTGSYNVSLIATNAEGCSDTANHSVSILVDPVFDLPNAFTPGRFDKNSTFKVEGYGIKVILLTIYNRWGQKLFESRSQKTGWDGTFKGVPQPMDVYLYTLTIEFVDGRKITRQGDLTLLR